jgi:hypothetical protein
MISFGFQTAIYCWVCQMLYETSFQIPHRFQSYCDTSYLRGGVNKMTHKNNIVRGVVIFVMEERQVFSNVLLCGGKLGISHHCCLSGNGIHV